MQRMEPFSSLQVQYTVPSHWSHKVLCRGWSPSQAYRYSTLLPPLNTQWRSYAEDGTLLKLTGTVHYFLPLNTQGPMQRMEPFSSLQVQYTVPSPEHTRSWSEDGTPPKLIATAHCSLPWTHMVLCRGWNPSQAYRYSTLFPPLNTQGPVQRMEPFSSWQVQYTVPSPEHTRSCTEDGTLLKLTGTVHCSLPWTHKVLYRGWNPSQAYRYSILFPPLNTQGPVQRMEPLSSLQVQYTVPSPEHTRSCAEDGTLLKLTGTVHCSLPWTHKVLFRRWNPSQAYRYSTLFPPSEHTRSCTEEGAPLKLTGTVYFPPLKLIGTVHCSLLQNTQGPVQRMEPLSSLQVQYTVPSPWTHKVLYRGWSPSQAYRYSTLFPPSEHTRSCTEDGAPLKLTGTVYCPPSQAYRYSTLFPPPEHTRSCTEDGASLKLTGTVYCPPLKLIGKVHCSLPWTHKVLCRGTPQVYRYSKLPSHLTQGKGHCLNDWLVGFDWQVH